MDRSGVSITECVCLHRRQAPANRPEKLDSGETSTIPKETGGSNTEVRPRSALFFPSDRKRTEGHVGFGRPFFPVVFSSSGAEKKKGNAASCPDAGMVASRPAQLPRRERETGGSSRFRPLRVFFSLCPVFGKGAKNGNAPEGYGLVFRRKLPLASEPTDPCATDVGTGTASTSVLKLPLGGSREGPRHQVEQLSTEHMLLQPRSAPERTLGARRKPEQRRRVGPYPPTRRARLLLRRKNDKRRHAIGVAGLGSHPFSGPLTSTGGLLHIP